MLQNSVGIRVQRCYLVRIGKQTGNSAAIGLAGVLIGTTIRENVVFSPIGVGSDQPAPAAEEFAATRNLPLLATQLAIEKNSFFCTQRGISLVGTTLHALTTTLSGLGSRRS